MKPKLTLSWRIGLMQWEPDDAFDRLLALLKDHASVVDEVALFDTVTHHLYIPLETYAPRMQRAAHCLDVLRRAGVRSAGLNVLCTIGHINEAWSTMPPLPFQPMVGHDGSVSTGCACPNTPEMRAYVKAKYALAAQSKSDFIWVDDDIRMHHHGVTWGCFCPACLSLFSKSTGRAWSREDLARAFDEPGQGGVREAWVDQNIASLESLLADVKAAVHGVDPGIRLGKMTCGPAWTTYSGAAFNRWVTALGAAKVRPGGGFYQDATPGEMVTKALECGRQRAGLPAAVKDIQYELENFPYQRLKKSVTALVDECSLALAYGLNGIAFNLLGMSPTFEDALPAVARLPAVRRFWEQWVKAADGLPTGGLWPAWSPRLLARRTVRPGESWLGWSRHHDVMPPRALADIGLPLASDRPAAGVVLCGRVADAFTDAELEDILSGGVLMDGETLATLEARGLGRLCGVRLARRLDNGLRERFTADPLNGPGANSIRDARIEFWGDAKGMGDVLEPLAGGVRTLTVIEDYFSRPEGPGMTAYENERGGRIVVMGYAPWLFISSLAKRAQLLNAADWLSRGSLPVRVEEPVPLFPVARVSADRPRAAIMLLNAGLDAIPEATVRVRVPARQALLQAPDRRARRVPLETAGDGVTLTLRNLAPWSVHFLTLKG